MKILLSIGILALSLAAFGADSDLIVRQLKADNTPHPIGLDKPPQFRWIIESKKHGCLQTAYQIQVASTVNRLKTNKCDFWNTGKISSDQSVFIPYAGKQLEPERRYFWRVRIWDNHGNQSPFSDIASFEMGPIDPSNWKASWIGSDDQTTTLPKLKAGEFKEDGIEIPAVMLRREFTVPSDVKRAWVYFSGLGYSELRINGSKIGDHVLDPGYTDYNKRVLYVTYDLTNQLKIGQNAIGALLGGGWYDMPTPDEWEGHNVSWRKSPRLLFQLKIELADGTIKTILSDKDWKVTKSGPIVFNSVRSGETYDARREMPGWDKPGFDDSLWKTAKVLAAPKGKLSPQLPPPIKVCGTRKPVNITNPKSKVFVYDFGTCIAGWAQTTASGLRGTRVRLKYGETLQQGLVTQKPVDRFTFGRFQTDEFILDGDGLEKWEPRFCYHAFRYVEVTGLDKAPSLIAKEVHTALTRTGSFKCSNELINRIQEACVQTFLSNFHSIPTDCPSREKLGWMGDGLFAAPQGFLNFDMTNSYQKWIDDMRDAQFPDGGMPAVVPFNGWSRGRPKDSFDSPGWGCACVVLPWKYYRQYGDRQILAENYGMMTRYVDYMLKRAPDFVPVYGTGDWLEEGTGGWPRRTPKSLTGTAYFYLDSKIASETSNILGHPSHTKKYQELANNIKHAFHKRFYNSELKGYVEDSQTAHAMPLNIGLTSGSFRPEIFDNLIRNVTQKRKGNISAGIIGVRHVLKALTDGGRGDLAYSMVNRESYPSWGFILNRRGNGTISENWRGGDSQNHPAYTVVSAWFYRYLAGINSDPSNPGFKHIIIKPIFPEGLTSVEASYKSVHGLIKSAWIRKNDSITMNIEIPANSTATIILPIAQPDSLMVNKKTVEHSNDVTFSGEKESRNIYTLGSGDYSLTFELHKKYATSF